MFRLVAVLGAVLALAACDQINQARDATLGIAGGFYVDQVCGAGPVAEPIRDAQRDGIYQATGGLYVEADCAYQPGDTVDDFLARKREAAAESLDGGDFVIITPEELPSDP